MAARLTWSVRQSLLRSRHKVQVQSVAHKYPSRFSENDHRGGYDTKIRMPFMDLVRDTRKNFIPELLKMKQEAKEYLYMEKLLAAEPGDYEIPFKFDSKESIGQWVVTCDADHNEGNSWAHFELGKNKTGIFHGYIDANLPKDGATKYAGYANIRGPRRYKSMWRQAPYEWLGYNTLMIRYRGDGRPYQLLIKPCRHFDVMWNDQFHYPLFTRGGPYWQEDFIPITKFYMTSKGRIQNLQHNLLDVMNRIESVALTVGDGCTGSFHLEIDYIGIYADGSLNQNFVYEMYETPAYKVLD